MKLAVDEGKRQPVLTNQCPLLFRRESARSGGIISHIYGLLNLDVEVRLRKLVAHADGRSILGDGVGPAC